MRHQACCSQRLVELMQQRAPLSADGPPTIADVLAFAERHGIEITGQVAGR
jgi:hypothetical protein